MNVTIRPMSRKDLGEVLAIEERSFAYPWDKRKFLEELALDLSLLTVAVFDGKICGYVIGRHVLDEFSVMNLAVSPDCRRRGVGRKLIGSVMEYARVENIGILLLEVRSRNTGAIKLYESAGFGACGVRKNYYPDDDALLMSMKI
jgi:[ribosomal protein S18]-alanine N-acetyltransferase